MKRTEITIGETYRIKEFGTECLARVTDVAQVERSKHPWSRYGAKTKSWKVFYRRFWVHSNNDDGVVTLQESKHDANTTLSQVVYPCSVAKWKKWEQDKVDARVQNQRNQDTARSCQDEAVQLIKDTFGVEVRKHYDGSVTIPAAQLAEWVRRQR